MKKKIKGRIEKSLGGNELRKYNKLINSGRWDEQQIGGKLT